MSYKTKSIFAEGVTEEQVRAIVESAGGDPSMPPPGCTKHEIATENDRLVYIDEWESKEAFENFNDNMAIPMLQNAGIPAPETEEL